MTAVATQTCFSQFILRFSQPLADNEIQHHTSHPVLLLLLLLFRVIRHDLQRKVGRGTVHD